MCSFRWVITHLNNQPFAVIDYSNNPQGELYYIHNDHLGTPQALTNEAATVVWQAHYRPFGKALVNEDPDLDSNPVVFNLRFPGQYFDQESGLHYNYFRDYDPQTGRYIQSDPIGLSGGMNTYGYVGGNPLRFVDPFGLAVYGLGGGPYSQSNTVQRSTRDSGVPNRSLGDAIRYGGHSVGFGGQFGATSVGPEGWSHSTSIGISAYFEVCTKKDECQEDDSSWLPDFLSTGWVLLGATVRADGAICFQFGLLVNWPPVSLGWDS